MVAKLNSFQYWLFYIFKLFFVKFRTISLLCNLVISLPEFTRNYGIKTVYGAYAAHLLVAEEHHELVTHALEEPTVFDRVMLVKSGTATMQWHGQQAQATPGSLLVVPSGHWIGALSPSCDFLAELLLVAEDLEADTLVSLSSEGMYEAMSVLRMISTTVSHSHIHKVEMIRSLVHVLKLLIAESPYAQHTTMRDIKHKKEIYEVFLHNLKNNFRRERQLKFYADKQNITSAYLSRTVKELSGITVSEHVAKMLYNELCNLLVCSDRSMGEIAALLHFSDQSAMTNFFKARTSMSPLAYRRRGR